jgi:hypothetical protein
MSVPGNIFPGALVGPGVSRYGREHEGLPQRGEGVFLGLAVFRDEGRHPGTRTRRRGKFIRSQTPAAAGHA